MLPNLLHPVPIEIEAISRAQTRVDPNYREPIQNAARGVRKTCPGQVYWVSDEKLNPEAEGARQGSDGYVLFRLVDLAAVGLDRIHMGDRIVATGTGFTKIAVDLYIVRIRYMGHYPDQGGPSLVRAYFQDRMPSKQTRGGK